MFALNRAGQRLQPTNPYFKLFLKNDKFILPYYLFGLIKFGSQNLDIHINVLF